MATDVQRAAAALTSAGESCDFRSYAAAEAERLERVWWSTAQPALITLPAARLPAPLLVALAAEYPADFTVWLIRGDAAQPTRLDGLAEESGPGLLFLPPLPAESRRPDYAEFVQIIARLRAPDGCPWDRQQTHASLKRYLLEETYETLEAIDSGDPRKLCEELGDVLLQVVLHAQIAAEAGNFTERDVCALIVEKMIRRHPHVFGETEVEDAEEVLRNWETIKRDESPERTSALDGVPETLPALLKALDISKRAVKVGFEWPALADVWAKAREEMAELEAEIAGQDGARLEAEMGDLLFTLVNVARWLDVDPEEALRRTVSRFSRRFREVERLAEADQRQLAEMDITEMDALWDRAKARVG